MRFGIHSEVDFTGLPVVTEFTQSRDDDPQKRVDVGEDSDDTGSALEFLIYTFDHVGGTHPLLVSLWEFKAVEAFRERKEKERNSLFAPGTI